MVVVRMPRVGSRRVDPVVLLGAVFVVDLVEAFVDFALGATATGGEVKILFHEAAF